MRKKLLFILICLLGLMLVTGCGKKEEAPPAPEPVVAPEAETPPAAEPAGTTLADLLAKGKAVEGMTYDMTMTAPAVTMTGHYWVQGKNMKMDITVAGQQAINIINADKGLAYVYMPGQEMAMKMPINSMDGNGGKTPLENMNQIDPANYVLGEEVDLNGVPCRLVTNSAGGVDVKMWVSVELGIPMKVESTSNGQTTTMEYSNVKVGPVPAETFELPEGTKLIEVPQE